MKNLLFILVFLSTALSAQSYQLEMGEKRVSVLSNDDGFFQNTVNTIASDKNDILWLATPNGLISYDGYDFFGYYSEGAENSLPNNIILDVYFDSYNLLWVATAGGLCYYDIDKQTFSRLASDGVYGNIMDKGDSQIWVSTNDVIEVYSKGDVGYKLEREFKIPERVTSIESLSPMTTLVATVLGFYSIKKDVDNNFTITEIDLVDPLGTSAVLCLKRDASFIWLGTAKGLFQCVIDNGHLVVVNSYLLQEYTTSGLPINVLSLYLDRDDKLWIATQSNGVFVLNKNLKTFTKYSSGGKNNSVLSSDRINAFCEDDFGVMWIGTAQGGINRINKNEKPFYSYSYDKNDPYSLSSNLINGIVEDNKGYLWVSSYGSPMVRSVNVFGNENFKDIRFKSYPNITEEFDDNSVISFFQDSKGWWWLSTYGGLFVCNEDHSLQFRLKLEVNGEPFKLLGPRVVEQIDDDRILLGADKIVILNSPWEALERGAAVEVDPDYLLLGNKRRAEDIAKDDHGNYWIATEVGIVTISVGQSIQQVRLWDNTYDTHIANKSHVFTIHKDTEGDMWIGMYSKGIAKAKLDTEGKVDTIVTMNRQSGLLDDMVYGILEDEEEGIWMSTDMGIWFCASEDSSFMVYDVNDGLPNNNFRRGAYLRSQSGLMLLGGLNGLCVFDPKEIKKSDIPAKISIASLLVNNEKILPNVPYQETVFIDKAMSDVEQLQLDYSSRNISLEVVTHHTASTQKNKLKYMLQGIDEDWIVKDEGKVLVNYTNLPAGKFIFRYKGANGDGVWMENEQQLLINVIAPWYKRWWSITFFLVMASLILYFILNYYLKVGNLRNKLALERVDKERLHDIDQAKLRLFTNLSHEFKTPLALIIAPLEKIVEQSSNAHNMKYISIIQSNIERLQRLIDSLINYRKNESGKMETHYTKTSLGEFINPLLEAFEENIVAKNIGFTYNVDRPGEEIVIDENKTELVLFNLLSNAIKYTKEDGEINLDACFRRVKNQDRLVVEVSDNGQGMSEHNLGKIFDRFYRIEEVGNENNGTGIGLAFSKSLVDSMNGEIEVTSDRGVSTSFTVVLPYDNTPSSVERKSSLPHFLSDDSMSPEKVGSESANDLLSTVLVIDDEVDFRRFLFHSLEDKYNVLTASSGEAGLEMLQNSDPQLVICDVMMPGISGFEVCEKIKEDPNTCHIPVILLTALTTSENEFKGIELGADYYIKKPFSIKQLEVRIHKLIENRMKLKSYYSAKSYLPDDSISMSISERNFLKSVNEIIERNMMNSSFGVQELAKDANCSKTNFYRRLKQLTGQIPNAYLRNYRLEKAAELLSANHDILAAEVMYQIGMDSPSYFSTSFKKLYGMAPSEYRNKVK